MRFILDFFDYLGLRFLRWLDSVDDAISEGGGDDEASSIDHS